MLIRKGRAHWKAVGVGLIVLTLAVVSVSFTSVGSAGVDKSSAAKPKIAVLLFSRGFEFMVALDQATRKQAKALGYDVVVLDGKGNTATQISQIEDQIAGHVAGLVVSPNNSQEIVPGIQKANAAGIPVVTVDAIAAGGKVAAHVGFDNVAGGRMAANYLGKALKGKGTVLELTGALGEFHAVRRQQGFDKQMKAKFPGIKVVVRNAEWLADKALSLTVDNLTKTPGIAGIYTHNDEMQRGVVSGLAQVGKNAKAGKSGHIVLVGIDGTPTALERIRGGTQDASVVQDPFVQGKMAIDRLNLAIKGKPVTKKITQTLPVLVTKANASNQKLWGNAFRP